MAFPAIVVPGITASSLRDEYPVDPETVWSTLTKRYERIALHPDDVRYEVREPARVVADQLFEIAYADLVKELRHNLTDKADEPTPVFTFAYDWRQPLELIELQLELFIEEVIARTKLLRHFHRAGYAAEADSPAVDLVGHSMGGMIIAGYMERLGRKSRVRKVATLGSPFRGSFEAVIKVATGTADLGGGESHSRERETARLTPALYHLLPSFDGGIISDRDLELFSTEAWQTGVFETIAEYIRLYGLDPARSKADRLELARSILASMLEEALLHRQRLESITLSKIGLSADDWLCVVGLGVQTRVRLRILVKNDEPWFDLSSDERVQGWPSPAPAETGDGTVPFAGAMPAFLRPEHLVCLTPGDFGYWEIGDRLLGKLTTLHAFLPNMNVVHRLITAHFKGEKGAPGRAHPGIWGWRAPGVEPGRWLPPITNLRDKELKEK
ncbi:MAG: esterase/lipase family protein [Longimicrobiales bacterium]